MSGNPSQPNQTPRSLGTHLWLVLMKAHQSVYAHDVKSIESSGLCFSDFAALEALLHLGPLPVNTIAEKVLLTSGSMTTAIDRLERKGLVERQASITDRRIRTVHLTAEGRMLIESFFEKHQKALDRATSGLSDTEKETLIALLKKLGKEARRLLESNSEINP